MRLFDQYHNHNYSARARKDLHGGRALWRRMSRWSCWSSWSCKLGSRFFRSWEIGHRPGARRRRCCRPEAGHDGLGTTGGGRSIQRRRHRGRPAEAAASRSVGGAWDGSVGVPPEEKNRSVFRTVGRRGTASAAPPGSAGARFRQRRPITAHLLKDSVSTTAPATRDFSLELMWPKVVTFSQLKPSSLAHTLVGELAGFAPLPHRDSWCTLYWRRWSRGRLLPVGRRCTLPPVTRPLPRPTPAARHPPFGGFCRQRAGAGWCNSSGLLLPLEILNMKADNWGQWRARSCLLACNVVNTGMYA